MIIDDFAAIARAAKGLQQPAPDEIRRFVEVYDCAMGCYPSPGTDLARVRDWLLRISSGE